MGLFAAILAQHRGLREGINQIVSENDAAVTVAISCAAAVVGSNRQTASALALSSIASSSSSDLSHSKTPQNTSDRRVISGMVCNMEIGP